MQPSSVVVDVGCGTGAASLPLAPPAVRLVGADESEGMLAAFARRCDERGLDHAVVRGTWPTIAPEVEAGDVVVCHHVLYNVAGIEPFVLALDDHARRRVVVEITAEHPLAWMNPLWTEVHGVDRPDRPVADDAVAVLTDLGLDPKSERWSMKGHTMSLPVDDRVAFVRRRLCVGPERDDDVRAALERHPFPDTRGFVTLWWDVAR